MVVDYIPQSGSMNWASGVLTDQYSRVFLIPEKREHECRHSKQQIPRTTTKTAQHCTISTTLIVHLRDIGEAIYHVLRAAL